MKLHLDCFWLSNWFQTNSGSSRGRCLCSKKMKKKMNYLPLDTILLSKQYDPICKRFRNSNPPSFIPPPNPRTLSNSSKETVIIWFSGSENPKTTPPIKSLPPPFLKPTGMGPSKRSFWWTGPESAPIPVLSEPPVHPLTPLDMDRDLKTWIKSYLLDMLCGFFFWAAVFGIYVGVLSF